MSPAVRISEHPLIKHKITKLRDKRTSGSEFRELVKEITTLLLYEATADIPLVEKLVKTPIAEACEPAAAGKAPAVVSILRAGLGMADAATALIPEAAIGFIGLYRDEETLKPVEYYCKLPGDIEERLVLLVDPMLATGGSAADAAALLKAKGARNIKFICLVAAPQGVEAMTKAHADVEIYIGALDEGLNDKGYIIPGLGDAGDRLFGTD